MLLLLTTCLAFAAAKLTDPSGAVKTAIDPIVIALADKYNCSISVALQGPAGSSSLRVASAAGITDRNSGRRAQVSDPYVWGSVTKMITGSGVLQLVDQQLLGLDDIVPPHIDPFLAKMAASDPSQNYSSLEELWGPEVHKIRVRDLLGMTSGVPDYDTASPSGKEPTDFFRADSYEHPARSFTPSQLLNLPWVRTGKLQFAPGRCDRKKYYNCYSSTNYVLLGFLLAQKASAPSWDAYVQKQVLSKASHDFSSVQFAMHGPPAVYTPVHGYDTTHYNNNTRAIDVSDVSGVFGGWTAADFVADAMGAASLGQDLYGPAHKLVSRSLVEEMYSASNTTGYGLATFNLSRLTPNDVAYGHLGATYGYQSIVVFAPGVNLSIAIATNIERDHQDQPQDVFCSVYNTAKAILQGAPKPHCTFSGGYWTAGCHCKDNADVII